MPIIMIGATSNYRPLPFQFSQLLNRIVHRIDDRNFLSVVSIATYKIQRIGVFETMQVEFIKLIQINIMTSNNHIFTSTM